MIFSDYTEESMENFDAVLENYGVERADGIVIEGDAQHYAMQMPYYIVPEVKSAEPVSGFASEGYFEMCIRDSVRTGKSVHEESSGNISK